MTELRHGIDLGYGDSASKRSAFWTMLVLSGVIIAESTVLRRAMAFVFFGMVVVVSIGLIASVIIPADTNLLANPQIASRTASRLIDMRAAFATGFAGAVGLARRDVSDVLPGVAIAISLVPPLVVVGSCLGKGEPALAVGALLLFASNVLAMVVAGTFLFAAAYLTGPNAMHRERP